MKMNVYHIEFKLSMDSTVHSAKVLAGNAKDACDYVMTYVKKYKNGMVFPVAMIVCFTVDCTINECAYAEPCILV